ncbi:MAG: hypothetical protein JJLCMIEE_00952 [Acidimicrobiales bacterium]|nr:MAG: Crp/Fnr family transcriptional regulator [Actinomycetota bacterium]MBV6507894.1 hypothetical protein [Acidimicrobiales bacterium]RIK06037.1 MAG: hypothetical protein DCC48_08795 [Acidobacteriota bacterium]
MAYRASDAERAIGSIGQFSDLAGWDRRVLVEIAAAVDIDAGSTLVSQGQVPELGYIVVSGTVGLSSDSGEHRRANAGTPVGLVDEVSGEAAIVTAIAETPVHAVVFDRRSLERVVSARPAIRRAFLRLLSLEVRKRDLGLI